MLVTCLLGFGCLAFDALGRVDTVHIHGLVIIALVIEELVPPLQLIKDPQMLHPLIHLVMHKLEDGLLDCDAVLSLAHELTVGAEAEEGEEIRSEHPYFAVEGEVCYLFGATLVVGVPHYGPEDQRRGHLLER